MGSGERKKVKSRDRENAKIGERRDLGKGEVGGNVEVSENGDMRGN